MTPLDRLATDDGTTPEDLGALEQSGLFDHEFYRDRYMAGQAVSPRVAMEHFLRYARIDHRTCTSDFDATAYVQANPDVEASRVVPILHYIANGHQETRIARPLEVPVFAEMTVPVDIDAPVSDRRIAVVLHIFYDEYARLFADLLTAFPMPFDLFVTVRDSAAVDMATQAFSDLALAGRVRIVATPNRGRNFLGLFSVFAQELKAYDYVAHAHSKKSLYTGEFKADWALSLVGGVLGGGAEHVSAVLRLFESRPQIGVICADRHHSLPYWASHWLRNSGNGVQLFARMGMELKNREFVDYPVGGMFWARVSCLTPLLDLGLTEDDFPEEHGQLDGAIHHAIERAIGALCQQADMEMVKYSARHGLFHADDKDWIRHYTGHDLTTARRKIGHAEVVSFDIFDTLAVRDAADTEEAKRRVMRSFQACRLLGGRNYLTLRDQAEDHARRKSTRGDVSHEDIIAELAALAGVSVTDAARLMRIEADEDLALLKPRRAVMDLAWYASRMEREIIYVTDMYYPETVIQEILNRIGAPPGRLYVSSEMSMRKDTGQMWRHLREVYHDKRMIHFGDNMVSDVQLASDNGVASIYVLKNSAKALVLGAVRRAPTREEWPVAGPVVMSVGDNPFLT